MNRLKKIALGFVTAAVAVSGTMIATAPGAQAGWQSWNGAPSLKVRSVVDTPERRSSTLRVEVPRNMRGKVVKVDYVRWSNIRQGNRPCNGPTTPDPGPWDCIGTTDRWVTHTEGTVRVRLPHTRFTQIRVPVDLGSTPNVYGSRLEHYITLSGPAYRSKPSWAKWDSMRFTSTITQDARFTRWSKSRGTYVWTQVKDLQP